MSRVRSRGNKLTELALIKIFREQGIAGWRRGRTIVVSEQGRKVVIRPDFTFHRQRIAVFVDGEFWHGHPRRAKIPQTNREFWIGKIGKNRARDRLQNRLLRQRNWIVVRIWQFELRSTLSLRKLKKAGVICSKSGNPPAQNGPPIRLLYDCVDRRRENLKKI